MKVAVAGSSGLIGSGLVPALHGDGHEVVRLVRGDANGRGEIAWHPSEGILDPKDLDGIDAVVNLAGAGIGDKRWTDERKKLIVDSRVGGTALLAETMAKLDKQPRAFLSGSAVGWYGYDAGDAEKTEDDPRGAGFLADVVEAWEGATAAAQTAGIRVVHLRTGIVQSTAGGALAKQLLPFKVGLGGRLGSGRQYIPWISLADEVAAIRKCLMDDTLSGPVNLTAPEPVTNREYTKTLGAAVNRPTLLPIPLFPIRAAMGRELVDEMLLGGNRVLPIKLEGAGFEWRHPTLQAAFRDIL
jgi:uncharacterized protein (TIGR01777 family)